MAQEIATEQVWRKGPDGVERLVAAVGDPIPPEDAAPLGYSEAVDLEADTADARKAKGEAPVDAKQRSADAASAAAERAAAKYAPPLQKPGESDEAYAERTGQAKSGTKAKKSADVEDKAVAKKS